MAPMKFWMIVIGPLAAIDHVADVVLGRARFPDRLDGRGGRALRDLVDLRAGADSGHLLDSAGCPSAGRRA